MPIPRKDKEASVRIACPIKAVSIIRKGAIKFGTMCQRMIRRCENPQHGRHPHRDFPNGQGIRTDNARVSRDKGDRNCQNDLIDSATEDRNDGECQDYEQKRHKDVQHALE